MLGIGGSASTDGGAGMLNALGARLLDTDGDDSAAGGGGLEHIDRVDLAGLHPALAEAEVVVASDVDNPLLGDRGAAAVYGPQKGATPDDVARLDGALRAGPARSPVPWASRRATRGTRPRTSPAPERPAGSASPPSPCWAPPPGPAST